MIPLRRVAFYGLHAHQENAKAYAQTIASQGPFTFVCPQTFGFTRQQAIAGLKSYHNLLNTPSSLEAKIREQELKLGMLLETPPIQRTDSVYRELFDTQLYLHQLEQGQQKVFLDYATNVVQEHRMQNAKKILVSFDGQRAMRAFSSLFVIGDYKQVNRHLLAKLRAQWEFNSSRDASIAMNVRNRQFEELFRDAGLYHLIDTEYERFSIAIQLEHERLIGGMGTEQVIVQESVDFHKNFFEQAFEDLVKQESADMFDDMDLDFEHVDFHSEGSGVGYEYGDERGVYGFEKIRGDTDLLARIAIEQMLLSHFRQYLPSSKLDGISFWKEHRAAFEQLDATSLPAASSAFMPGEGRIGGLRNVVGFLEDIGHPSFDLVKQDIPQEYSVVATWDRLCQYAEDRNLVEKYTTRGLPDIQLIRIDSDFDQRSDLPPVVGDSIEVVVRENMYGVIPGKNGDFQIVFEDNIGPGNAAKLAALRLARAVEVLRKGADPREAYGEGILTELKSFHSLLPSRAQQEAYAGACIRLHESAIQHGSSIDDRSIVTSSYDVLPGLVLYCKNMLSFSDLDILRAYKSALEDGAHKDPIGTFAGELQYVRVAPFSDSVNGLDPYLLFDSDGVGLEMFSLVEKPKVDRSFPIDSVVYSSFHAQRPVGYISRIVQYYIENASNDNTIRDVFVAGIALAYTGYEFGSKLSGEAIPVPWFPDKAYANEAIDMLGFSDRDGLLVDVGLRISEMEALLEKQGSDKRFLDAFIADFDLDPGDFYD